MQFLDRATETPTSRGRGLWSLLLFHSYERFFQRESSSTLQKVRIRRRCLEVPGWETPGDRTSYRLFLWLPVISDPVITSREQSVGQINRYSPPFRAGSVATSWVRRYPWARTRSRTSKLAGSYSPAGRSVGEMRKSAPH